MSSVVKAQFTFAQKTLFCSAENGGSWPPGHLVFPVLLERSKNKIGYGGEGITAVFLLLLCFSTKTVFTLYCQLNL